MENIDGELQKKHLEILVRNDGFQFTETFFPYTSGKIGPYYTQSIVVEKNGLDYKNACDDISNLIRQNTAINDIDIISGGESRDWDFSNVAAYILEKSHAKIYKIGEVLGADMKGKNIVHVADLNNEGSSPRKLWIPIIKKAGGKIKDIFFYVDRMEEGVQVMKDLGLRSHSLVQLDEYAWNYLRSKGEITKEIYNSLRKRMENKEEWAKKMLRSDKGIDSLFELIDNPKTNEKGMKIINKGYPDMKEELLSRLKKI